MMIEKLVEWLAGETKVLGENLSQCRFVNHKPHMLPGREHAVGSQRLTAWVTARSYVDIYTISKKTGHQDGSRVPQYVVLDSKLNLLEW
jgi:hypothetical protein